MNLIHQIRINSPKMFSSMESHIRSHPFTSLAVSNGLLACLSLYVVSEGRPLRFLYKHLFRAALSLVPSSVIQAEEDKVIESIEKSVIGDSLEGESLFPVLPVEGACMLVFLNKN